MKFMKTNLKSTTTLTAKSLNPRNTLSMYEIQSRHCVIIAHATVGIFSEV